MESILKEVQDFRKKYEQTLSTFTEAKDILAFYEDDALLNTKVVRVALYLFYRTSLDTQDTEALKKQWEFESLSITLANELLFISQAWKTIGYDQIIAWSHDPLLEPFKNDLVRTAESLKRILSEKEEYVLNIISRPLSVIGNLSEELTNSFLFPIEIDGKKQELTDAEIRSLRESNNREIRRKAFESIHEVYGEKSLQITLWNCYSGVVKNWATKLTLRGYTHVMEPRNVSEELDDSVVNLLMNEVQSAYGLFARFLKAKARALNLDPFYQYDIFAPLKKVERTISLEEAVHLHLETMADFDDEFHAYSQNMFQEGRVDVFPRAGKRSGAFASYEKNEESFVLLNFTGKLLDVPTISHELWHAIHGHLSQVQKSCVYGSPLCLAETASIFCEMLLSEQLKKNLSQEEKLAFLADELQDMFASIFRQIQYVSFEKRVHETISSGKELTYHEFNRLWREEQRRMTLDSVIYTIPDEKEIWWSTIPHIFHTPFYCYAYSFGHLLTLALYERYQSIGKSFIPSYKAILASGGSKRPKDLLSEHGFDITDPTFYQKGLSIVAEKVKEFEILTKHV